jgi:hypothetical protein
MVSGIYLEMLGKTAVDLADSGSAMRLSEPNKTEKNQ